MIRFRHAALASSVLLLAALHVAPASAQNVNGRPNYGTINLRSGFAPDPHVTNLRSGGSVDASTVGANCRGFISGAPDVRLVFSSGSLPLIISANSRSDTTLVVNAPDGSWYCDDDSGSRGLNPALRFDRPQSGRYEIWVGTYGSASTPAAQLHISEVYSQ